jgi:hypothetical protein
MMMILEKNTTGCAAGFAHNVVLVVYEFISLALPTLTPANLEKGTIGALFKSSG